MLTHLLHERYFTGVKWGSFHRDHVFVRRTEDKKTKLNRGNEENVWRNTIKKVPANGK